MAKPSVTGGTVINDDCLEILGKGVLPHADVVHTSPPYNIDKPYREYTDKLHLSEYLSFITRVAQLLHRNLRIGGSLFWQTGYTQAGPHSDAINPIDVLTYPIFRDAGFYLKDRIVWRYYGGMSFKSKFKNQHETILWYVKGDPEDEASRPHLDIDAVREESREHDPRNNLLGRNPGNVWEVDRVAYGSIEQTSHIAVFPEEVSERIVRACSRPGDTILDPFLGSGTVAKVARSLGRHYVGIELSRDYYLEAVRRLGYQPWGELNTVLSELLKSFLLSRRHKAPRRDCEFYLTQLPDARPTEIERLMNAWCEDFEGVEGVHKRDKPKLWERGDRFLGDVNEADANGLGLLGMVAHGYLRRYKLAKAFNGLRIALIAYGLKSQIEARLNRLSGAAEIVDSLIAQEPSSYDVGAGNTLILKNSERRIKQGPDQLKGRKVAAHGGGALF